MDTDLGQEKLKDLYVEERIVRANDRKLEQFEIDPAAEKRLLRKVDLRVVPVLWLLFVLAFLDRTNIGNASVLGMVEELGVETGNSYHVALSDKVNLFEVPSNIIIKRIAPSTWIAGIMFFWGIVTSCQGLVKPPGQLQALRFLLGLFESGFFPGCLYLISMYYKRYELQSRLNIFFTGSILAGSFSGLLAYGISHMDGVAGYSGWRGIFILEALLTAVVAVLSKFAIVDWPETCRFLDSSEKELLIARLAADVADAKMNRLDRLAYKRAFGDWKVYCGILMYFGIVNNGYAVSFFTPTILTNMGYSPVSAQVHSIPIFIIAAFFCVLTAFIADKLRHRYAFTIFGICVATVGYGILFNQDKVAVGVQYFAVFLIVTGGYICQPTTLAWMGNNTSGHYKRAISSAMMVGFGNAGGIVASNVFIAREVPAYPTSYGTTLALLWVCALACTGLLIGVRFENKKRDTGGRDYTFEEADADNLGDDHPHFRFTY